MAVNKLYKVTVKGVKSGKFARNASPGVTYVVASSIDKAYNAVLLNYGKDNSLGTKADFELDTIQLVASESAPNQCESDTYKLITNDSWEQILSQYQINIDNTNVPTNETVESKDVIDEETLLNNITKISEELEEEGYDLDNIEDEDMNDMED